MIEDALARFLDAKIWTRSINCIPIHAVSAPHYRATYSSGAGSTVNGGENEWRYKLFVGSAKDE